MVIRFFSDFKSNNNISNKGMEAYHYSIAWDIL